MEKRRVVRLTLPMQQRSSRAGRPNGRLLRGPRCSAAPDLGPENCVRRPGTARRGSVIAGLEETEASTHDTGAAGQTPRRS